MKENTRILLLAAEMLVGLACALALPFYLWQSLMIGTIALVALWITGKDYCIEENDDV